MLSLSIAELVVVLVVAILVLRPEDLPLLIQQIVKIKRIFTKFINEFNRTIDNIAIDTNINSNPDYKSHLLNHTTDYSSKQINEQTYNIDENIDQVNYYLQKIVSLGSVYNGEYELHQIREFYNSLNKQKLQHNAIIKKSTRQKFLRQKNK